MSRRVFFSFFSAALRFFFWGVIQGLEGAIVGAIEVAAIAA